MPAFCLYTVFDVVKRLGEQGQYMLVVKAVKNFFAGFGKFNQPRMAQKP